MFLGLVHAALRRAYPDYATPLVYASEAEAAAEAEPADPPTPHDTSDSAQPADRHA